MRFASLDLQTDEGMVELLGDLRAQAEAQVDGAGERTSGGDTEEGEEEEEEEEEGRSRAALLGGDIGTLGNGEEWLADFGGGGGAEQASWHTNESESDSY